VFYADVEILSMYIVSCAQCCPWAPAGFFLGWAMRGLKDRSPPAGSRGSSPVGLLGRILKKMMTFSQNDA